MDFQRSFRLIPCLENVIVHGEVAFDAVHLRRALAFFRAKKKKKARASGRNVGKVFNRVLKLVFENHPFSHTVMLVGTF